MSRTVKILHATNWYFPDTMGGIEVYVAELARRQRAAGMQPVVVAPEAGAAGTRTYEWHGTPVVRYPIAHPGPGFAEVLRRVAPDVAHFHSLGTGLGIDQVAAARRVTHRVVFTAHLPSLGFTCLRGTLLKWGAEPCDGHVDEMLCATCTIQSRGVPRVIAHGITAAGRALGGAANAVPGRLGTGLRMPCIVADNRVRQSQLLRDVDYFVALNRRALDIVRANGAPAQKLVLNTLGVGVAAQPKASARQQPTPTPVHVGFIGRIHETKGLRVLAQAVRALPPELPISISIFGPSDGPESGDLVRLLKETAERDARMRVHGPLHRRDVADTLRTIDVLCCPSTWFENGPTIALEAQAVGTPVIGSNAGAMPEFIDDGRNGRVLPAGQWEPLRDALVAIAQQPAIVDRWREALPPSRSMDDVARDYERLYGSVAVPA